jgi:hypothetical protein
LKVEDLGNAEIDDTKPRAKFFAIAQVRRTQAASVWEGYALAGE